MSNLVPRALALVFVAGLWACNNDSLPLAPSATAAGTVSFKTDVAPLLAASCAGCHAAGQDGERDLLLFVNGQVDYSAASSHISKIVSETQRGDMPKNKAKLTTAQLAILQAWKSANTPNN